MLINHSEKTVDQIVDVNGNPLWGERLMFTRIMDDCQQSSYRWHVFYNLGIEYPMNGKPRFEIDFLLACIKGIVIVEVKGGRIEIQNGAFVGFRGPESRVIPNPFHQAEQYKWGLFNNDVVSEDEVVIATVCAFPSSNIAVDNLPATASKSRLWGKKEHVSSRSFADFCISVLENEKKISNLNRPDLSEDTLDKLISRRLASSVFTSGDSSDSEVDEALDWLRVDDENSLASLAENTRIFISGGPGTGKTTIAKTFIKHHRRRHGLYLCWNNMLAAKFRYKITQEGLGDCDVETYLSLAKRISGGRINVDNISSLGEDAGLREEFRDILLIYLNSEDFVPYDYLIVDEIHDVLDKGVDILIDSLSSMVGEGLSRGRFLAFYDREQGFMNQKRDLSRYASLVSSHAAKYRLLDCRRVLTNQDIITYARRVKDAGNLSNAEAIFSEIEQTSGLPITIMRFDDATGIMHHIQTLASQVANRGGGNDCVLLTHSNVKNAMIFGGMPLLNGIRQFAGPSPLTKDNVNEDFSHRLPTANILEYKGLECRNVVLLLFGEGFFDTYEMYIGMSRAIQSLTILILDNHA